MRRGDEGGHPRSGPRGSVGLCPSPDPLVDLSQRVRATLAGRIERHVFGSGLLADDPLGDPAERPVEVYLPPGYDDDPERRYPSVYVIQGYTGAGPMWHNRSPFRPTFPEAGDALFAGGEAPACVVVLRGRVDGVRRQPVRRLARDGPVPLYLCDEVVPFVDARYRTLASAAHRGSPASRAAGSGP